MNWEGLVAGTGGSVHKRLERMGAVYATGDKAVPIRVLSAPAGGSLASIRAEAARLRQLRRDVGHRL